MMSEASTMKTATVAYRKPKDWHEQSTYQPPGPLYNEDGKSYGQVFAPPLVTTPVYYPVDSFNNDVVGVTERVTKWRNDKKLTLPMKSLANEFIHLIVKEPGAGVPLPVQTVIDGQTRPAQRARNKAVLNHLTTAYRNVCRTMGKKESYPSAAPVRAITTHETNHQLHLGAYTKAFKIEVLRLLPWFSPGDTPIETCERLAEICQDGAIGMDVSKFDGSISEDVEQCLVRACYMLWAADAEKPHLAIVLKSEDTKTATTSNGFTYDPGMGRKSGSPMTSDGNTIINAFITYAALRRLKHNPAQAFENLGLYCGDDSVNRNIPGLADALRSVGEELGFTLKIDVWARGEPIYYLGRYFLDPTTTTTSIQDPKRTLVKLHTTTSNEPDLAQLAANKVSGYLATDAHTPIIGTWCQKVIDLVGKTAKVDQMTHEEAYRISNAWPQDPVEAYDLFLAVTGFTADEVCRWSQLIDQATSIDRLPHAIIQSEGWAEHKIAAIIGHEIVGPAADSETYIQAAFGKLQETCSTQQKSNAQTNQAGANASDRSASKTSETSKPRRKRGGRKPRKRSASGSSRQSTNSNASALVELVKPRTPPTSCSQRKNCSTRSAVAVKPQKTNNGTKQRQSTRPAQQPAQYAHAKQLRSDAPKKPAQSAATRGPNRTSVNRRRGHDNAPHTPNRINPDKRK